MQLLLQRSYTRWGVIGSLYVADIALETLERQWLLNTRNISCIPEGVYQLRPYTSAKFPNVFELQNVPHRNYILIHAGNTIEDVTGCIAVGCYTSVTSKGLYLHESKKALNLLRSRLEHTDDISIRIKTYSPEYP